MKLIITEAHYKFLLENLIDEAVPSEHFYERQLGRFVNKDEFNVGYDEGDFNYITVGTVKKDMIIKKDYSRLIEKFENYDLPDEKSYGIKIENLRIPIKDIEISQSYIRYFKENIADIDFEYNIREQMKNELNDRFNIPLDKIKLDEEKVKRRIENELKREIKNFLYSKANDGRLVIVDYQSKSYGNQTYLVIRNNVMITIFLGISTAFRNPQKKLDVDYYFDSIESFEANYQNTLNEEYSNEGITEDDIVFNNTLFKKLIDVHTKIGQGSIFSIPISEVEKKTKEAIINYLQDNEVNGSKVLEVTIPNIGYDLVVPKENLNNYSIDYIKTVYKKERDASTGEIMKIPVKAAKVNNSISEFSTNKMSIIFAKSKTEEGKYFVITVLQGNLKVFQKPQNGETVSM